MEHFINSEIADVNQLNKVTLAHNPHFLQFKSAKNSSGSLKKIVFEIDTSGLEKAKGDFIINFVETKSGAEHKFTATFDKNKVNNSTFLIISAQDIINEKGDKATYESANALTAQNFRFCLMQDAYFRNNFDIRTSYITNESGNITEDKHLIIKANNFGEIYEFIFQPPNNRFITTVSSISGNIKTFDSIDYNTGNYNIELDIYSDTGVFLGEANSQLEAQDGKYLTTLSKAYLQNGIWFDLNTLFSRKVSYSDVFLEASGWCNAGTVNDFRIIGKRNNGINHNFFYASDVLYVINGYDYTLQENDLSPYIFDATDHSEKNIKPLTNSPRLLHEKGQKHFFNFILKDPLHSLPVDYGENIGLMYRFFTQSHKFISQTISKEQKQQKFDIVNTIEMDLDKFIIQAEKQTGKTVGHIEVCLCKESIQVSEPILFDINSSKDYQVNDFAFLNRLGGWDCFNFGNSESVEFKTTSETFFRTLEPGYKTYNRIESVSRKNIQEKYTVKTHPIRIEVAEWLRELSSSPAVYELSTKRYIIVEELTLKYNSIEDLFQMEMKYHYSDNFNSTTNTASK